MFPEITPFVPAEATLEAPLLAGSFFIVNFEDAFIFGFRRSYVLLLSANLKIANEMLKDPRELTIEEEGELLKDKVEEEAHLADVEELLGDEMDTTMEADYVVDHGSDKSLVQSGSEIEIIVLRKSFMMLLEKVTNHKPKLK